VHRVGGEIHFTSVARVGIAVVEPRLTTRHATRDGVTLPVHAAPQPPQLSTVVSGVSQPLDASASQVSNPALHDKTQVPPVHEELSVF